MSTRLFLGLSLVANVVLLGVWLMVPNRQVIAESAAPFSEQAPKPLVNPAGKPQSKSPSRPSEIKFHWSQVASDDPAQLVANLRSIQCPDGTIQDIFIMLAFEKFAPEVHAIAEEAQPSFYELLASSGGDLSELAKPEQEKLKELEERVEKYLKHKPNSDVPDSETHLTRRAAEFADLLPPEEASRFAGLEDYYRRMRDQASSLPEAEREPRRAALKAEQQEALEQFLTAEQIAEIEFRTSGNFKDERPYFEATPAEWNSIKQIQLSAKQTNAPSETVRKEIERFLGPQRAEEFQQQSTSSYTEFLELTMEAGLPRETARLAHDVRVAAEKARQEMPFHRVPSEYRIKLQEAWRQDTMNRLQNLLGAEPYAAYMRSHQDWLKVQE
jgi:hypothetical protein